MTLSIEEGNDYFRHLAVDRFLRGSTCRQHLHATRFLCREVLRRKQLDFPVPIRKRSQCIASGTARVLSALWVLAVADCPRQPARLAPEHLHLP